MSSEGADTGSPKKVPEWVTTTAWVLLLNVVFFLFYCQWYHLQLARARIRYLEGYLRRSERQRDWYVARLTTLESRSHKTAVSKEKKEPRSPLEKTGGRQPTDRP
jgi:hypothetical protein